MSPELPPDPNATAKPPAPKPEWHKYVRDGIDREGRKIDDVYAIDDDYVIYFSGCELFYQATAELLKELGAADAACALINRMLPELGDITDKVKASFQYKRKLSTLQLVADGYEMIFCGHKEQGLQILDGIRDRLQTSEEGKRRLWYQAGTVSIAVVVWIAYFLFHWFVVHHPSHWVKDGEPWLLAAALAIAGGTFSVCLNIDSLPVSVNQQVSFLFVAGATRSVVALLAGAGVLLALRAKMLAGFAYKDAAPGVTASLQTAEMFFCFLAGFSERFVPNILSKSEDSAASGGTKPTTAPTTTPKPTTVTTTAPATPLTTTTTTATTTQTPQEIEAAKAAVAAKAKADEAAKAAQAAKATEAAAAAGTGPKADKPPGTG
jgi:hypothetical protein